MNFDLTEEQRMWQEAVHDFVKREVKPKARQVDEEGRFNWEATHKMGPLGLLGLTSQRNMAGQVLTRSARRLPSKSWGGAAVARPWRLPPTTGWVVPRSPFSVPLNRSSASCRASPAGKANWRRWR